MNSHLALFLSCLFLLILQGTAYTCSRNTCESCGDGFCDVTGTENCATCPFDCGICYGCINSTCGDGICDALGGETGCNCPSDCSCCLDGVCTATENYINCPADCVGALRGVVVDAFNWSPLPGSNVVCGPYGNQLTFNQITDSQAKFLFTNLPPGLYSCTAEYGISISATYVFQVYKGSGLIPNRTEVIPINLPTGILSGVTYYQPTGAIFPQVRVVCNNGTTRRETFSDVNGVYLFTGVHAGTYSCVGTYPGYTSGVGVVYVPQDTASTLDLYLNKLRGGIVGNVLDCTTGLPVESTVTCVTPSGTVSMNTTRGFYYFPNIASGVAVCTARPFDLGYCQNNNTGVVPASLNLTLNIVVFPVPSNLSGFVYDLDTGLALPFADVVCTSSSSASVYATISNSNGKWAFYNISAGNYSCHFSRTGYNSSTLSGIVLTSYKAEQTPNVYLAGLRGCVRIFVQNSGYYQGVNASIKCFDTNGKLLTNVVTPATGEVFLPEVIPGHLTCTVTIPGHVDRTAVIPVPPGDRTVRYDFRMIPELGTLTGLVTDSGNPVRGAYVVCLNTQTQETYSGTSDTNGNYSLPNIPVGPYSCRASLTGYSDNSFNVQISSTIASTHSVTLSSLSSSIIGRVIDNYLMSPLSGANVNCSFANTSSVLTFTTAADGLFFFSGLTLFGAWRCTAQLKGYQLSDPRGFVPVSTSRGTQASLQIPLISSPGSLTIKVISSGNALVPNAKVYCGRQNSNKVLVSLDQYASATLSNLPAGQYSCTATADPLYLPVVTGFVEVKPGTTTSLSVVLNPQT